MHFRTGDIGLFHPGQMIDFDHPSNQRHSGKLVPQIDLPVGMGFYPGCCNCRGGMGVKGLVMKVRKVRNDGLGMFRRFFANIFVLGRYTRGSTKSKISSNVRCLNICQP